MILYTCLLVFVSLAYLMALHIQVPHGAWKIPDPSVVYMRFAVPEHTRNEKCIIAGTRAQLRINVAVKMNLLSFQISCQFSNATLAPTLVHLTITQLWFRIGAKPFSEPMLIRFYCLLERTQWRVGQTCWITDSWRHPGSCEFDLRIGSESFSVHVWFICVSLCYTRKLHKSHGLIP